MLPTIIIIITVIPVIALTTHIIRNPDTRPTTYTNPWRIGNTVVICEDPSRTEMNWNGTVLSTHGNIITVRDNTYPYHAVDLERHYAFDYRTEF